MWENPRFQAESLSGAQERESDIFWLMSRVSSLSHQWLPFKNGITAVATSGFIRQRKFSYLKPSFYRWWRLYFSRIDGIPLKSLRGILFFGMVPDTLSGRNPLHRLEHFFEEQDTDLLLGNEVDAKSFYRINTKVAPERTVLGKSKKCVI